jgi:hypothetical protein
MRTLTAIFLLTILFGCSDRQSKKLDVKNDDIHKNSIPLIISAIDAKFPLRLDKISLDDKNTTVQLNDGIIAKIEEIVKEYSKDFEFYDSSQTNKDTYLNTIRLQDSVQTIFLVLLKHYPTGEINSRVLFYDNQKKEFAENVFDFNLWVLYNFENGKLTPTKLKTDFKITTPEIEIVDFNKDEINDYKLVRLWHNGTFNAIHTTILTVRNNKVETLHFDEKPIRNEELRHERS